MSVIDEEWIAAYPGQGIHDGTNPNTDWMVSGGTLDTAGVVMTTGAACRLIALAPQMARLVLAAEFMSFDEMGPECAECRACELRGHKVGCVFGKLCDELRAIQAAP